jgi:hypothetical protein
LALRAAGQIILVLSMAETVSASTPYSVCLGLQPPPLPQSPDCTTAANIYPGNSRLRLDSLGSFARHASIRQMTVSRLFRWPTIVDSRKS